MEWYSPWACLGNDVPCPHFSFPFPKLTNDSIFSVSSSGTSSVSTYPLSFHYFFCLA
jgi:hypothetical protein